MPPLSLKNSRPSSAVPKVSTLSRKADKFVRRWHRTRASRRSTLQAAQVVILSAVGPLLADGAAGGMKDHAAPPLCRQFAVRQRNRHGFGRPRPPWYIPAKRPTSLRPRARP